MLQIDVIKIDEETYCAVCVMSYNGVDVRTYMALESYEEMKSAGLFIRDGLSKDSAGVINTTKTFIENAM